MPAKQSFVSANFGGRGYSNIRSLGSAPQPSQVQSEAVIFIQENCLERFKRTSQLSLQKSKEHPHILEAKARNPGVVTAFANTFTTGVALESSNRTGVLLFNFPGYADGLAIVPDLDMDLRYSRGKVKYSQELGLQRVPVELRDNQGWVIDTFRTYDRLVRERGHTNPFNPLLIYKIAQPTRQ